MNWSAKELNRFTDKDMRFSQTPSYHRYLITQVVHATDIRVTGKKCGTRGQLLSSKLTCDVTCRKCLS